MNRDGNLISRGEHPRIGHLPGVRPGLLQGLRPPAQLPCQRQRFRGSTSLQAALRRRPETVGEMIHGTSQRRRINHEPSLRAAALLPTGERSGTVT